MHHYVLEDFLVSYGLGLRTVLAGGDRCQYAPQKSTGQSLLYYTNEPSDFGKAMLDQQFVYNPAEFQMNTAFALAYTLESLGSAEGLVPNRVYIEANWLTKLNAVLAEPAVVEGQEIRFSWRGQPAISIAFDDFREVTAKGLLTNIFRVRAFVVHDQFEGETTEFQMCKHDRNSI